MIKMKGDKSREKGVARDTAGMLFIAAATATATAIAANIEK